MANKGPLYGLSKDCRIKASKKFDVTQVREVLHWMEAVLGRQIHSDIDSLWSERDAAAVLKDGAALCELMNAIKPGAIKRINRGREVFKQMENVEQFTKACVAYGLRQLDVFQITDLFEVKAVYTVFTCLHALGSLAQKKGYTGPKYGVTISEKKERHFSSEQIAQGKMIIPMQAGTNVVPSQAGMTPYGFSRQIVPCDSESTFVSPASSGVISLQYGTHSTATQSGMTPYGLGRQITLPSVSDESVFQENSTSGSEGQNLEASTAGEQDHLSPVLDELVIQEKTSEPELQNNEASSTEQRDERKNAECNNNECKDGEHEYEHTEFVDVNEKIVDTNSMCNVESSVDGDVCNTNTKINGSVVEECAANGHIRNNGNAANDECADEDAIQVNGSS